MCQSKAFLGECYLLSLSKSLLLICTPPGDDPDCMPPWSKKSRSNSESTSVKSIRIIDNKVKKVATLSVNILANESGNNKDLLPNIMKCFRDECQDVE
eukprot:748730-Hanusia_phi.AAC.1